MYRDSFTHFISNKPKESYDEVYQNQLQKVEFLSFKMLVT
jgi:hypothetical protein